MNFDRLLYAKTTRKIKKINEKTFEFNETS